VLSRRHRLTRSSYDNVFEAVTALRTERERGVNVDTLDSTLCWLVASALDCPFSLEVTTVAKRHRTRRVLGRNGSASTQHA
jgi:hypothetical protein